MYTSITPVRSVQISLDDELLREVDRQKESRERGRSAFIRRALRGYLELQRQRRIDRAYERAYGGKGDSVLREFDDLLEGQAWPDK